MLAVLVIPFFVPGQPRIGEDRGRLEPSYIKNTILARTGLTACVIAVAIVSLVWQTGGKIGVSPDSTSYIYAARTVAEGRGLLTLGEDGSEKVLTHFPPLLPALLGVGTAIGIDVLTFAKVMNCVLFAGNLLVLMLLVYRQTRSFQASLATVAVAGTTWTILLVHSYVLSEPLFLLFALLCAYCLADHVSNPRLWVLALAGAFASLAFLSRYVGLCLLPVGVLLCLLQTRQPLARRGGFISVFLMLSGAGPVTWFLRNRLTTGTGTNRSFALHSMGMQQLVEAGRSVASTLPSPGHNAFFGVIGLCLMTGIVIIGLRVLFRKRSPQVMGYAERCPVVAVLFLTAFSYILLLVVSISTFDATTPLDERILAPAAVFMLGILAICMTAILRSQDVARYPKVIVSVLVGLAVLAGAVKSHSRIGGMNFGWADTAWSSSETLGACRLLPQNGDVYTNGQDIVWFLTGRKARKLPIKYNPYSRLPEGRYASLFDEMCLRVEKGSAAVVFFDKGPFRGYMLSKRELETRLHDLEKAYSDGAVFRATPVPPEK